MADRHPDKNLIALGIRQPWAELILRGIKTLEIRSLNTRRRGTIYLYSSKKLSDFPAAQHAAREQGIDVESLPCGALVGTAELVESRPCTTADARAACLAPRDLQGRFAWRLENPCRFDKPLTVRFLPYGVWFYPYQRRNQASHSAE